MPKRSNEFQQLIKCVYGQLVPEGASVAESASIKERNNDIEREVDILVEYQIAGHKIRIAIECRDRSRKDDVQWIDGLIGKYRNIDVNKVVAVSKAGFSKSAQEKAQSCGIETMTLKRALTIDWPKEYKRLGMVKLENINIHLDRVDLETEAGLSEQIELSRDIVDIAGDFIAPLEAVLRYFWKNLVLRRVHLHIKQHFLDIFKNREDLTKPIKVKMKIEKPGIYLKDDKGVIRDIKSLLFLCTCTFEKIEDVPVDHYAFGSGTAFISNARLDFECSGGGTYNLKLIQLPSTNQITIMLGELKIKKLGG